MIDSVPGKPLCNVRLPRYECEEQIHRYVGNNSKKQLAH